MSMTIVSGVRNSGKTSHIQQLWSADLGFVSASMLQTTVPLAPDGRALTPQERIGSNRIEEWKWHLLGYIHHTVDPTGYWSLQDMEQMRGLRQWVDQGGTVFVEMRRKCFRDEDWHRIIDVLRPDRVIVAARERSHLEARWSFLGEDVEALFPDMNTKPKKLATHWTIGFKKGRWVPEQVELCRFDYARKLRRTVHSWSAPTDDDNEEEKEEEEETLA